MWENLSNKGVDSLWSLNDSDCWFRLFRLLGGGLCRLLQQLVKRHECVLVCFLLAPFPLFILLIPPELAVFAVDPFAPLLNKLESVGKDADDAGFPCLRKNETEVNKKHFDVVTLLVRHQEIEDLLEVGDCEKLEIVKKVFETSLKTFTTEQFDLLFEGCFPKFFDVYKVHLLVGFELVLVLQLFQEHFALEQPLDVLSDVVISGGWVVDLGYQCLLKP